MNAETAKMSWKRLLRLLLFRYLRKPKVERLLIGVRQIRSPYAFRVRFHLSERVDLPFESKSVPLSEDEDVRIEALGEDARSITSAKRLAIIGKGYGSERDAREAAARWRAYVERGFARVHLGAAFAGNTTHFTPYGLRAFAAQFDVPPTTPVLEDGFGPIIYREHPKPRFLFGEGPGLIVGRNPAITLNAIKHAAEMDLKMPERDSLAFELFNASFSESSEDARFVMLMMAVETMIELEPREHAVTDHVEWLIAQTNESKLPRGEVQSLVGSLEWLTTESIGQGGRRLAKRLELRLYAEQKPAAFFTRCYEVRSKLVHGHVPRASVDGLVAALETFVGDLLSGELLDAVEI